MKLDAANVTIANLQGQIDDLIASVDYLKVRIATQDNIIATQNDKIATQDNKIATQDNKIAVLEDQVSNLNATVATQRDEISFLRGLSPLCG